MLTGSCVLVLICHVHCSSVNATGVLIGDEEPDAVLLGREVDPTTNFAIVNFSRPLVTSDDDDEDLDRALYLSFSFGPFNASSPDPIGDPGLNRFISGNPIQFDCSRDRKGTSHHVVLLRIHFVFIMQAM